MKIEVHIPEAEVHAWARKVFEDQIPFATSKAINATALDFQKAQREHQHDVFTIRRKTFVDRAVKIKPFATKQKPVATVSVDPPGGKARADILTQHEEGGTKTPKGTSLAVPAEARRTKTGIIRKRDRPRAYDFKRVKTKGRIEVYRGNRRTYMIRRPDGSGMIRRRIGKGKHGTHQGTIPLFRLTPKGEIKPTLDFTDNARRTVDDRFATNWEREFGKAIQSGRL